MIRAAAAGEVVARLGTALGLPPTGAAVDLVRPALRRASYNLGTTTAAELVRYVAEPLTGLGVGREVVEIAFDDAVVYGDLIETPRTSEDPWDAPPRVIRPAPPCYVARPDGTVVVLGVSGDLPSALTAELDALIDRDGPVRILRGHDDPSLPVRLEGVGFLRIPEAVWLREPRRETAVDHVAAWRGRLTATSADPGGVPNLEIVDPSAKPTFYAGRWRPPRSDEAGLRVARRPRRYGSPAWCAALFEAGVAMRILEFEPEDPRTSPRDLAWRLQAAIDAARGTPQRARRVAEGSASRLDLFSPLPSFAERRLALVGRKTTGGGRLFGYVLCDEAVAAEAAALAATMWIETRDEGAD